MRMFRAVANFSESLLGRFRLLRYDDFTIAEYFRKQGAQIGADCRILLRDFGSEPYLIRIGNHCTIAGNVTFVTHDGAASVFTKELPSVQRFGAIEVLDNCFIGHGAILMPNVRIGPNSIVGAGSVVTKHVPPNTVVAGNPAKMICTLEQYRRKVLKTWEIQKPQGYMATLRDGVNYAPADIQKEKSRFSMLLREHLQHLLWDSSNRDEQSEHQPAARRISSIASSDLLVPDRRRPVFVNDKSAGRRQSSE